MHTERLHLPHLNAHRLSGAFTTMALKLGIAARFVLLSTLAILLCSQPISLREVTDAGHRPAPRA